MVALKMVFKVSVYSGKCKTAIFKAVAKLEGVDEITVDDEKGTVTVIGEVDPVCVARQLRKVRQPALIDSVGPKKPSEKEEKKEDKELPSCGHYCNGGAIIFRESVPGCTIL